MTIRGWMHAWVSPAAFITNWVTLAIVIVFSVLFFVSACLVALKGLTSGSLEGTIPLTWPANEVETMPVNLQLDQMSFADKMEAMELLWADISKQPDELPSPAWHREVLEERRKLVEEGKVKFIDWDTAMAELREELRGNSST